ncbi:tumor susceptibility gene 101 protein [Pelomyxa schiedti]|nr:tumor susceptibility gene 101 protein [Pelomyxa schiedti]
MSYPPMARPYLVSSGGPYPPQPLPPAAAPPSGYGGTPRGPPSQASMALQNLDVQLSQLRIYRDPTRVKADCAQFLGVYSTFAVTVSPLPANAPGASSHVISLTGGTIPVSYKDSKYNIPIAIYIIDAYPSRPPIVFVTPTANMALQPQHRNVGTSGLCNTPYLANWNMSCNLLGMAQELCSIFSRDPPVRTVSRPAQPPTQSYNGGAVYTSYTNAATPGYAQGSYAQYPPSTNITYPSSTPSYLTNSATYPVSNPTTPQQNYPPSNYPMNAATNYQASQQSTPYGTSSYTQPQYPGATTAYPTEGWSSYPANYSQGAYQQPQQYYGQPQQPPQQTPQQPAYAQPPPQEDPQVILRKVSVQRLEERLQQKIQEYVKASQQELETLQKSGAALQEEVNRQQQQLAQMKAANLAAETQVPELNSQLTAVTNWVEQNKNIDVDIDTQTELKDVLLNQLVREIAKEHAIEDLLFCLERQAGKIPVDEYLKTVRALSHELFEYKALILKIQTTRGMKGS